jgi:general secretion pathway protein J
MRATLPPAGFTLVEVMLAIAIFALTSAIAYRGLTAVLTAREHLVQENHKWRALAMLFARIEGDLTSVVNRPVRDSFGNTRPAFEASADPLVGPDDAAVSFTRMGFAGYTGVPANIQRLGYRLNGQAIEKLTWNAPDQPPRGAAVHSVLLSGVTAFDLRYLDRNRQWQTRWPQSGGGSTFPVLVEMTLTLASGERFTRLFALPLQ